MTQYFVDFNNETTGAAPANWTTNSLGTGAATVEVDTGDSGNKVYRIAPQSGIRHSIAKYNVIDSDADRGAIEVVAKIRFPTGLSQYYQGGGLIARVEQSGFPILSDGYGMAMQHDAYTTNYGVIGDSTNIGGNLIELVSGSAGGLTPASNTWYGMRFRCNGSDLKAWYWLASGTAKYNTDSADLSTTDTDFTIGSAGLRWDTNDGRYMEVDWIGFGTNGDAAPMTAGGGPLFPTPARAGLFGYVISNR